MNKPHILQIGPLSPSIDQRLQELYSTEPLWNQQDPEAFLRDQGETFNIIVTNGRHGCSADIMAATPNVEVIVSNGVGYDPIDIDAARERKIGVSNTPDVLNDCVADLAMGLMLSASRRIAQGDRYVRAGKWGQEAFPLGSKVSGKRLGILGLGRIGQCIARRAAGFDMEIRYHNRRPNPDMDFGYESSLVDLARWSDFLMVTCVGGPSTVGLVSSEVMAALGSKGTLINVSRGSVVDQEALLKLLQTNGLGAAALDVFAREPKVPEELLAMEQVVMTPHIASGTVETRRQMEELVFENLSSYIHHGKLVTPVI